MLRKALPRFRSLPSTILLFSLAWACVGLPVPLAAQNFEVMTVRQEVALREKPGFIYKETGRLLPGEEILVDLREGDWIHIPQMGWIPAQAAEPKSGATHGGRKSFEISVETARLRSGPGTDHDVVGTADRGDRLPILEEKDGWIRVANNSWVYAKLGDRVEADKGSPPGASAGSSARTPVAVVIPPKVNLRGGPGTEHPVVGSVEQGENLRLVEMQGDWFRTERGGWIRNDLIRPATSSPAAGGQGEPSVRQWGLLSILGVYIKIVPVPPQNPVAIRTGESLDALTGSDNDYTFMSILVDVPPSTTYRFNFSPSHNRVQITDSSGRRFGNYIQKEGDLFKLPPEVRALFQGATVFPGNVHTGLLAFSGELDPGEIEKVEIFMSGRMHELYLER